MSLLLFFGSSCVPKKFIVNNADTLIERLIRKRLPLNSAQKKELSNDVKKFLNEHHNKAHELLVVIEQLHLASLESIEVEYQKLARIYESVALSFSGILSKHISQLDAKQQKEFFKNLEKENQELTKDSDAQGIDQLKDRLKNFFGSFNEEQKIVLNELKSYLETKNTVKMESRINLQHKFREILALENPEILKSEQIQLAFTAYRASTYDHKKNVEILKALLPTISSEQRKYFHEKTNEIKAVLKLYLKTTY
jgi:hypothetical protein